MVSETPFFNSRSPKNVISCIGDGMGFKAVKAAGYYASGEMGTLSFEAFPHRAEMATYSADSPYDRRCCNCHGDGTQS